jgi:two-component system nitrate/nitrite response regulator NarL
VSHQDQARKSEMLALSVKRVCSAHALSTATFNLDERQKVPAELTRTGAYNQGLKRNDLPRCPWGRIFPIAEGHSQPVTTVLICQNNLVRSGISSILAGTAFALSQPAFSNLSVFDDKAGVLCLVCADRVSGVTIESVERVKGECPNARVVILANDIAPTDLMRACQTGLDGFCPTAMSRDALIGALELVMLGEKFLPAKLCLFILEEMSNGHATVLQPSAAPRGVNTSAKVLRTLSSREIEILQCLMKGSSNKQIARELGLADATVKVHIKAILRKVRLVNRTQAAIWAREHLPPTANYEAKLLALLWQV